MLIEQIIELKLRELGPPGRTCIPTASCVAIGGGVGRPSVAIIIIMIMSCFLELFLPRLLYLLSWSFIIKLVSVWFTVA